MAEALTRKRKVRAAHRASVTHMITQSKEMLDSGEELSAAKLKQKRQALEQKLELLLKLDAEIVEIIDEDVLDEEIEQADIIREKTELDLDSALYAAAATSKKHEPQPRTQWGQVSAPTLGQILFHHQKVKLVPATTPTEQRPPHHQRPRPLTHERPRPHIPE